MTNTELVEKYLAHRGMKRIEGKNDDIAAILPFLIMDCAMLIWEKDIAPTKASHECQRYKTLWRETYKTFNHDFLVCYNEDERDEIIDKMDSLGDFVANDIMIAKVCLMNLMKGLDLEGQGRCASAVLVNVLCQAAQVVWKKVYKTPRLNDEENAYIRKCQKYSYKVMNMLYSKNLPSLDCNNSKEVCDAVDVLCRHLIKWLYEQVQ